MFKCIAQYQRRGEDRNRVVRSSQKRHGGRASSKETPTRRFFSTYIFGLWPFCKGRQVRCPGDHTKAGPCPRHMADEARLKPPAVAMSREQYATLLAWRTQLPAASERKSKRLRRGELLGLIRGHHIGVRQRRMLVAGLMVALAAGWCPTAHG